MVTFRNDPVRAVITPPTVNPMPMYFMDSPAPSDATRVSEIASDSGYIRFPCSSTISILYTKDATPIPKSTPPPLTKNPSQKEKFSPINMTAGKR